MKKLLLTMIVSIALCGSMLAQHETHWPEFNMNQYENNDFIVSFIQIDGSYVESTDNWADLEVGAFVGDEIRGHAFLEDLTLEYGDPHPLIQMSVYYDNQYEAVSFVLYDHSTDVTYTECVSNIAIETGEDHMEEYDDPETSVVLNFSLGATEMYTRDILGYDAETDRWFLVASPIGSVDPGSVTNMVVEPVESYDLYAYDAATTETDAETGEPLVWRNYKAGEFSSLEPGKGYLYANAADVTLTFTGTAYTGSGEFVTEAEGWNLMGNPYATAATVTGFTDFLVMNAAGTNYVVASGNTVNAMEGIFVQATSAGQAVTFTAAGGEIGGGWGDDEFKKLDLRVSGNGTSDLARIRFSEGEGLEKLMLSESRTKLCFPQDGKDFAVVHASEMGELPVSFKAEKNGVYTLSFTNGSVSFGYLHLVDNMTGADVDLLETPVYSFEATTSDYASRFKLVFATGNATEDSFAFFSNGSFVINNEGAATLQVVDATGRILSSESIEGCASVSVNAAAGVYTIRLISGDSAKVQKVVVR